MSLICFGLISCCFQVFAKLSTWKWLSIMLSTLVSMKQWLKIINFANQITKSYKSYELFKLIYVYHTISQFKFRLLAYYDVGIMSRLNTSCLRALMFSAPRHHLLCEEKVKVTLRYIQSLQNALKSIGLSGCAEGSEPELRKLCYSLWRHSCLALEWKKVKLAAEIRCVLLNLNKVHEV